MAKATKDWACAECGHPMTAKQAEKASFSVRGCPKCGGSDIDLKPVPVPRPTYVRPLVTEPFVVPGRHLDGSAEYDRCNAEYREETFNDLCGDIR